MRKERKIAIGDRNFSPRTFSSVARS